MLAKGFRRAYRALSLFVLGSLACHNYLAYRTLWRDYRTEQVSITSESNLSDVVRTAEGDNIKERITEVINEKILFHYSAQNDTLRMQLLDFLSNDNEQVYGEKLSLEEKVRLALKFSTSLQYNYKANFLYYAAQSKNPLEFPKKSIESIVEFTRLGLMTPEDLVDYKQVVCLQYAEVFAHALHEINAVSKNPEELTVGTIVFVPNVKSDYGAFYNIALSFVNHTLFSEWRASEPHAINIVAAKDKIYIVDPQLKSVEQKETLEINREYASELNRK